MNCRRTDTVKGKKWMRRSGLNRRKCADYVEKPWVGESDRDSVAPGRSGTRENLPVADGTLFLLPQLLTEDEKRILTDLLSRALFSSFFFFSLFVSIDSSQDGLTTAIDYGQSIFAGKGTGLGTAVWRHR
jgi:hypothetical protein